MSANCLIAPRALFFLKFACSLTRFLHWCRREEHDTLDSLALVGIDRQLWFMGI